MRYDKWDERFIGLAKHVATWSKDPSTKVGCVLIDPHTKAVVALGFNGFPRGVREEAEPCSTNLSPLDPARWRRPTKYDFIEHAERNAIYNAARHGHPTQGLWAYLSWDPTESVCTSCARALIQAGIQRVLGPNESVQGRLDIGDDDGWRKGCAHSKIMFHEAGVEVRTVSWSYRAVDYGFLPEGL